MIIAQVLQIVKKTFFSIYICKVEEEGVYEEEGEEGIGYIHTSRGTKASRELRLNNKKIQAFYRMSKESFQEELLRPKNVCTAWQLLTDSM